MPSSRNAISDETRNNSQCDRIAHRRDAPDLVLKGAFTVEWLDGSSKNVVIFLSHRASGASQTAPRLVTLPGPNVPQ